MGSTQRLASKRRSTRGAGGPAWRGRRLAGRTARGGAPSATGASAGRWKTAATMVCSSWARQALTLNESAYLAGSLPSHTVPSMSLLVRSSLLGTLTLSWLAACVYSAVWLTCLATAR